MLGFYWPFCYRLNSIISTFFSTKRGDYAHRSTVLVAFACFFIVGSSLLLWAETNESTTPEAIATEAKKIRVLLEEYNMEDEPHLVIKGKHGFVLSSPAGDSKGSFLEGENLNVLCRNNNLYLQCQDGKHRRIKFTSIEAANPHRQLIVSGKTYRGTITIRLDHKNKKVLVINTLPLDDYVCSVVRSESLRSWGVEMLKLQAIISRTYAAYQMTKARASNPYYQFYDIRPTNQHQVYGEAHEIAPIMQAVEETMDQVVTHKGKIALTMFDICCGGSIPAHMRCKDLSKPYLLRSKKCSHCADTSRYQWSVDLLDKSFLDGLRKHEGRKKKLKPIDFIADIKVVDADKAGVVHKVKVTGRNKKQVVLSGKDIRGAFIHKVRSLAFTIKKIRDRIVINGYGDGHLRGVCQLGAKALIDANHSIPEVLQLYYPGTTLSRLT